MNANYIVGKPHITYSACYAGSWERTDLYIPLRTRQHVSIAHKYDVSPIHSGDHYNSCCSCCYLGICHSVECHDQEVRVYNESRLIK